MKTVTSEFKITYDDAEDACTWSNANIYQKLKALHPEFFEPGKAKKVDIELTVKVRKC